LRPVWHVLSSSFFCSPSYLSSLRFRPVQPPRNRTVSTYLEVFLSPHGVVVPGLIATPVFLSFSCPKALSHRGTVLGYLPSILNFPGAARFCLPPPPSPNPYRRPPFSQRLTRPDLVCWIPFLLSPFTIASRGWILSFLRINQLFELRPGFFRLLIIVLLICNWSLFLFSHLFSRLFLLYESAVGLNIPFFSPTFPFPRPPPSRDKKNLLGLVCPPFLTPPLARTILVSSRHEGYLVVKP